MKNKTIKHFKNTIREEKDDFSEFFIKMKLKDKARIIQEVLREAIREQRSVLRKYEETKSA